MWATIRDFLWLVFGHWQHWLSGGGFGGLVVILVSLMERLTGMSLSRKAHALIFVASFFVFACFIAWTSERSERMALQQQHDVLDQDLKTTKEQLAQRDGTIGALHNQLQDQQSTINRFIGELGDRILPAPHRIVALLLEKNREAKTVKWIVLTNRVVTPLRMPVGCDGGVTQTRASIIGAGVQHGGSSKISGNKWEISIGFPAWGPSSPLLIEITHVAAEHGPCTFGPLSLNNTAEPLSGPRTTCLPLDPEVSNVHVYPLLTSQQCALHA
jgi:hypothetical protein